MGTLLPQQFFHFTQPAVCADCSILAETVPGSLRHLSHSIAVTLRCAMEQSGSCPHPLRESKATANYKAPFCPLVRGISNGQRGDEEGLQVTHSGESPALHCS